MLNYMVPPRTIVTSYKLYEWCKKKFKTHNVQPNAYCPENNFYYFDKTHKYMRTVDTTTGSIYKTYYSPEGRSALVKEREYKGFKK